MSTRFRNVLAVVIGTGLLALSAGASAGVTSKDVDKLRDQKSEQKSDQKSEHRSGSRSDSRQAPAPRVEDHPRANFGRLAPPARDVAPESHGNAYGPGGTSHTPSHDLNQDLARLHGNDRGNSGNSGGHYQGGAGGYDHRPPRVVEHLPSGYRDYRWNGNHYYSYGGRWYRPYGSTYISIGIPFGLFVGTLPGYYTSFWLGGTRYFYADDTYYLYEPEQRGYVVTHSPYGDDQDQSDDSTQGDGLYIYPAQGQTEQQQADDRYQCHRWAADQTQYDPLNDDYSADKRADYQRAMTACLTGRGYTVN